MKKCFLVLFLLFSFSFVKAQFSQVYLADSAMQDLDFEGDTLYFVTQGGGGIAGKLGKIESFDSEAPIVTILSAQLGLYPRAIEVANNIIYYANASKLRKFDLNQTSPSPEDIVSTNSVRAIYYRNNVLYLAEDDKISKVDLNEINPVKINLITDLEFSPLSFSAYNNELYVAHGFKISKFNMDEDNPVFEDVVTGLITKSYGIDFKGNELFIEQTFGQDNNTIIKINVNETPVMISVLPVQLDNVFSMLGLNFYNDDLYAGRAVQKDIIKIGGANLSVDDLSINKKGIQVFPNPVLDYLLVTNLTLNQEYSIVDTTGKIIQKGILIPNKAINVNFLSKGMYILILEDNQRLKFIKN